MLRATPPWPRWYQPPSVTKIKARETSAAELIRAVCELTTVTPFEFHSELRFKAVSRARHAVAYVLQRHRSDMSLSQIARATSRGCHSTIRNSITKATALRQTDPQFAELVTKLEATLGGLNRRPE